MRRLVYVVVAVVAGCGGSLSSTPTAATRDPLAQPEAALAVETLPGELAGPWPAPVVRGASGWLIPWHDADGVHTRLVGDDGARDDRFVGGGTLIGAAATDDGYAVAVADGVVARVHFLAGASDRVVTAPLDGQPALGAASDGRQLLLASTRGGEVAIEDPRPLDATLLLVAPDGARSLALGRVAAAPTLSGDAAGFIVGGTLLVDGEGRLSAAPGHQVRDARVFRRPLVAGTLPTRDSIALDGNGWLDVDGLVGFAERAADGARLEVVRADGRALVEVGADLTPGLTRALPPTSRGDGGQSWLAAARAGRVLWASTIENDPVFAILDAAGMRADSGVIRIRNASSRSTVTSAGPAAVLFMWTEGRTSVHYAVQSW